jgi:hypothetical protein
MEEFALNSVGAPRRRLDFFKTGNLFFSEGRQCIDCLVWNMGADGALIEVDDPKEVAAMGRLISESMYLDRVYRVVWCDGRKMGVVFDA